MYLTQEKFATSQARNQRFNELRETHTDVVRFSDPYNTGDGPWKDVFVVAYGPPIKGPMSATQAEEVYS